MDWYCAKQRVKCPYYVDHSAPRSGNIHRIHCQGIAMLPDGCDIGLRFKKMSERDGHMQTYCMGQFWRCPMCRIISEEERRAAKQK